VFGSTAFANNATSSTASGARSNVSGTTGGSAYGYNAVVASGTTGGTASGYNSYAGNNYASAYGTEARATGLHSTAIGYQTRAAYENSAAFGNGAEATHVNQQTFGTVTNTYTMPGITTDQSQSYQHGPLDLVTTDQDGNLASDNGDTFKAVSRLQAGVAVAMAAETPQITSSQNFGMRIGWGNYLNEANGVAASAIGVVCRGCFSNGDRIAVDGAVGAGWSSYKTYDSGNVVAGRAGVSWGW
jgi:trimeric autotransporter adhesin